MIILDTSVWIEYLRKNEIYFPEISKLLEYQEALGVECVFGELFQGTKNKSEREILLQFWAHLPKIHYENIIIEAGIYSSENKLLDKGVGLIDAIILMHSIKSQAKIWTLDKKFLKIIPNEFKYIHK
ncbi:MAG TPA: PIN domain nuclease [Treponema sp.]|nr:PIN domain nuclease [Treponema sp.]